MPKNTDPTRDFVATRKRRAKAGHLSVGWAPGKHPRSADGKFRGK